MAAAAAYNALGARTELASHHPPLNFLLWLIFACSGLHVAVLAGTAYLSAGGGVRGVLPAVVFGLWMFAGSELATRVWVLPEERENWALPFLSLRTLCTVQ